MDEFKNHTKLQKIRIKVSNIKIKSQYLQFGLIHRIQRKMHFALYGRHFGPDAEKRIKILLDHLSEKGARVSWCQAPCRTLPEDVDIFLSLGGDGTFLNSLTMVRDSGIPVAGINFGRLGFLTSAGSDDSGCAVLDRMMQGAYSVEKRSLIEVSYSGAPEDFYPFALNEVSIQKKDPYMIGIEVLIDGMSIPTYWADGLLIATATGSTAYSLSFGGPVVVPDSSVFIVTPMAPHNLNVRPLIVPDTSEIEIVLKTEGHPALLSADNRSVDVDGGRVIKIRKAGFSLSCVSFGRNSFFEALHEKLLWGEDRRNDRCRPGLKEQ